MRDFRIETAGRALAAGVLLAAFSLGCASSEYTRAREQDRRLSARVNEALLAEFPGEAVEGRAHHGVVALLGEVKTEQGRSQAEAAACAVPGVARVNNMIMIDVEGSPSRTVGSSPVTGTPVIAARAETAPAP